MKPYYKSFPQIVRELVKYWKNGDLDSSSPHTPWKKRITKNQIARYGKAIRISQFSRVNANPIQLLKADGFEEDISVFDINERKRQRILPGRHANDIREIHHPDLRDVICMAAFFHLNELQTLVLIAKVLFEDYFKGVLFFHVSGRVKDLHKASRYLSCLEAPEMLEYIHEGERKSRINRHIIQVFRDKSKTTKDDSDVVSLLFKYGIYSRDVNTSQEIISQFEEVVTSAIYLSDIVSNKELDDLRKRVAKKRPALKEKRRPSKPPEVENYQGKLLELTYNNSLKLALNQLFNDFWKLDDSRIREVFIKPIIQISAELKELTTLKQINAIEDQVYIEELKKMRSKLIDLVYSIEDEEILSYLFRNKILNLQQDKEFMIEEKILQVKNQLIEYNFSHVSIIIFDVDDFTQIIQKYGAGISEQILDKLNNLISDALHNRLSSNSHDINNYTCDKLGRDKYFLMVPRGERKALSMARSIRKDVEKTDWSKFHKELRITISGGVSGWSYGKEERVEEYVRKALKALNQAKMAGKNLVKRYNNHS